MGARVRGGCITGVGVRVRVGERARTCVRDEEGE